MLKSPVALTLVLCVAACCGLLRTVAAAEAMFPTAPGAKAAIDFDGKGFLIHGERTHLISGSIHYPRVPKDLWRDRLLRMARGGFNTVQTYAFWNYHEPKENQFDFSGEKDFEGYLKVAQDLGLFVTVRVGPYVCAEWDSGGYPVWAKFKPDVVVRRNNPGYIALQDHWLAEILPRVAAHQIHKGGNVILLQLENEGAWQGAWEGKAPDPYYQDLYDNAKQHGIEIPFFMSGYNHGTSPRLEKPDNSGRTCPWISTETWSGWYLNYGASDYAYMKILRSNSKLLARGASGQNFYMLHGGSNFDSWNDNETAASYDYGTIIGQAGDLRPVYFSLKANNLFATGFSRILDNATLAIGEYRDFAANGRVIGARKSPAGTVVFVQGLVGNSDPAILKPVGRGVGGASHIPALEVAQFVLDAPITANIKIVQASSRILGLAQNGPTTTLILFGEPGDKGVLALALGDTLKNIGVDYPSGKPCERIESVAGHTLRILSMSHQLSDRTWIVGPKGQESVVVGPEFVGEFSSKDGKPSMTIERPYGHPAPNKVIFYGPADAPPRHLAVKANLSIDDAAAPALSDWKMSLSAESAAGFDDSAWMSSEDPMQMGADGDISAFAWYRSCVQSPQAGVATLHFPGAADHLVVFVNGKCCQATPSIANPQPHCDEIRDGKLSWTATVVLLAGRNSIAVLASHQGRDKAGGYYGPIDHYYPKGLFRPVYVELAGRQIGVKGWKMRGGIPAPSGLSFQLLASTSASPAFFQATFAAKPPSIGADPILRATTTGLSRGTMFINGRCVGRYFETVKCENTKEPVALYLPECWLSRTGQNTLAIFDEEGQSPLQVRLQIEKAASREVIAVSEPADPDTSIELPPYRPVDMGKSGGRRNLASDKPVTASSSDPDCPVGDINDGDDETPWVPTSVPTADNRAWVQVDLGEPCNAEACEFVNWQFQGMLYSYYLEGSADGKTWTMLADRRRSLADKEHFKPQGNFSFPLNNAKSVRYVRLTIVDVLEPRLDRIGISEFRIWGEGLH